MGTGKLITGVWAALRTPRTERGTVDPDAFVRQLEFLTQSGLPRVMLNGAPGIHGGEEAAREGAKALLLPMPYFFPYSQEDLAAFVRSSAAALPSPILLYNLPHFTTGWSPLRRRRCWPSARMWRASKTAAARSTSWRRSPPNAAASWGMTVCW